MRAQFLVAVGMFAFFIASHTHLRAGEGPLSPISVEEARAAVIEELRSRGLGEEQWPRVEDLDLPVAVPARMQRSLRVSSVCWDTDAERARFRLVCREAAACLPFLVYARVASHAQAASCRLGRGPSFVRPAPEPTVHAGERATAVVERPGLRMTAEVVCLDRGARGEIIRVRDRRGHILRARVAGQARVDALLQ